MKRTTYLIKEVKETGRPDLVWNYDPKTGSGPLHISDKSCLHGGRPKSLTRCGRPMYADYHTWEMRKRTIADFRLCGRCGTSDDFAQALTQHDEWRRQRDEHERIRSEAERAARETEWEHRVKRIKTLAVDMIERGVTVSVINNGVAVIAYDGYEFEVKEKR